MAAARPLPLRPGAPPEIEIPATGALAVFVGALSPGRDPAAALEREPEFATSVFAPPLSGAAPPFSPGVIRTLFSGLFSAAERNKPFVLFETFALAVFPVVEAAAVFPALRSVDGATTNREASSASGMRGAGSGGTPTALITIAAFGELRSAVAVGA